MARQTHSKEELRKRNLIYSFILFGLIGAVWLYRNVISPEKPTHFYVKGITMGVVPYNVKYIDEESRDFREPIDDLLVAFNQSLSTYIPDSEISTFNKSNEFNFTSNFFYPVLVRGEEIYKETKGAFDPTIQPLVNRWGFGPEEEDKIPTQAEVDSLKELVNYSKIHFDKKGVKKDDPRMQLDFSAIAKGYAVDLVADLLREEGINNFMVEIGGELVCGGINEKGKPWLIGIDNPEAKGAQDGIAYVRISDKALATSGNYRNFYEKDGKKYWHTIDPRTGYPAKSNMISASVITNDCMSADSYATAFMVMGFEEAKALVEKNKDLEAILIYDNNGELGVYTSNGAKAMMK
ncbi:FAD:protein FMN transferase [Sediminitomix flava]|uniref:FAD:protein FMN transferase n=1 Tax=Sediminitomix flava TaxID=379075 RepID=A0A315YWT1_SEDFL|nr:FAD:protein FMN transferase [Sediminitomix flava]PWJ34103.1 thiamine biosynthesis lipoprotein [Sediminitomix flava]